MPFIMSLHEAFFRLVENISFVSSNNSTQYNALFLRYGDLKKHVNTLSSAVDFAGA